MPIAIYMSRYDIEPENFDAFERARDIRCGFVDADDLTVEDFDELYEYAGFDTGATLDTVFGRWNRGSGAESEAFIDAETRSLSVGDIVVDTDGMHLVAPIGFERLEHLELALEKRASEAERATAEAEAEAEAELERKFAEHVDEHGWF